MMIAMPTEGRGSDRRSLFSTTQATELGPFGAKPSQLCRKIQPHPQAHQLRILSQPQPISSPPTMYTSRALSTALRAGAPRAPIAVRVAATRSYAAAAAPSSASTKPPVALFGVDGTYASALVRLSGYKEGFLG